MNLIMEKGDSAVYQSHDYHYDSMEVRLGRLGRHYIEHYEPSRAWCIYMPA